MKRPLLGAGIFILFISINCCLANSSPEGNGGQEFTTVGGTRILITNFPTYQCGRKLTVESARINSQHAIELKLSVVQAPVGNCTCKASSNELFVYKINDNKKTHAKKLIVSGKIDSTDKKQLVLPLVHEPSYGLEYQIDFDCRD